MNKKFYPYILIIVLLVALLAVRRCQNSNTTVTDNTTTTTTTTKKKTTTPAEKVDRNHGFDRRISYLEYSQHAKCRMQCRHITQAEVEGIMQDGKINYNKSDIQNARCPRYALEGVTDDNQRVRIVFAQCDYKTEVVTVIDLDTDWSCHCPGD